MLVLSTAGCGAVGRDIGLAFAGAIVSAAVNAALSPPQPSRSREQPQPDTACERRLARWREVEQAEPPPELRCGAEEVQWTEVPPSPSM